MGQSLNFFQSENWVERRDFHLNFGEIKMPRFYFDQSCCSMSHIEVVVFPDASKLAISVVSYLEGETSSGEKHVAVVVGKSLKLLLEIIQYPVWNCVALFLL